MKRIVLTLLGVLYFTLIFPQNIKSFDKQSLGIDVGRTVTGGYIVIPLFSHTEYLSNKTTYRSFVEKNHHVYYKENFSSFKLDKVDNTDNSLYSKLSQKINPFDSIQTLLEKHKIESNKNRLNLMYDSKGNTWIASRDSGVYILKRNKLKRLNTKNGLPSNKVFAICEDHEGVIWIGTAKGICRLSDDKILVFNRTVKKQRIRRVKDIFLVQNRIIFRDGDYKIGYISDNVVRFFPEQDEGIREMFQDNDENIWIKLGHANSYMHISNDLKIRYYKNKDLHKAEISYVYKDKYDTLWIASNRGIGYLNSEQKYVLYDTETSFINQVLELKDSNLWFNGPSGSALYLRNKDEFISFNREYNINTTYSPYSSILASGEIIVGERYRIHFGNSDLIYTGENEFFYIQYSMLEKTFTLGFVEFNQMNEYSLLLFFNNGVYKDLTESLGNDTRILRIFKDSDNNIWLDTPTTIYKISDY